jgi:hypothetical protein
MVFRDIDADGVVLHLFRAFACHSRLAPGYPVQAEGKDEGGQRYPDPTRAAIEGRHPLPAVPSPRSSAKSHKTSIFRSGRVVSCGGEVVGAFLRGEAAKGIGVRAAAARNRALSLAKGISMGLKSGL